MTAGQDLVPTDPSPTDATPTDPTPTGPAPDDAGPGPRSWRTGNRTLAVLAGVAVLSLVAGLGLSRLVLNPAEAAARNAPPEAGPITVPVESRELSNDVTVRGDVVFDDAVDLRVETADLGERAVVTGQVPEVGATLDAGSVALEIAGRPVLVLPGGLPTYRTLALGVSGPDVLQLKAALAALGIGAGDATSDAYDTATAAGVAELYRRAGYPVPSPSDEASEAVTAAERAVRSAEADVAAAEGALASAGGGSGGAQVAAADAAVRSAERAVTVAQVELDSCAAEGCTPGESARRQAAVDDARDAVGVAQAERAALDAAPDTSGERASLTAARDGLADAREALADAREETVVALPASEVVFLETLPRRVDAVSVRRGGTVEGSVMSVSGATLQVVASADRADAALLAVGATGTAVLDDQEIAVTVSAIEAGAAGGGSADAGGSEGAGSSGGDDAAGAGRSTVTLLPGELTPEQVAALQGANVRVRIPVSSTSGSVLAVPLAALTAGPGGESRVEVMGEDGATALVEVETGLAAGGYVEVAAADGAALAEGDLVVIGAAGAGDGDAPADDEDADA
ncbi:hypothetical protein [Cellulomonas pakistanensis]|uniref:Peptidoglycan binding-like domain-containing protein n=1 Tax=Cellulomonas pakistanensis TaxID=992287 RepID=A0A919U646_9CELL|nr:hypothetical protein [Cellulomonas pakistanensis]GIG36639.1 hypothetical protein Cpa01nite_20200 [Cellulomonas pakistanensis]